MKLTGPVTFIQMLWNPSLKLINIPRLRFSHFVIDTISCDRMSRRRIQACYAHADLKLLARFFPELHSTQFYYHYYYYYYYYFFWGCIPIERFRSRGQHICKFMKTKEIVKKEFNSLKSATQPFLVTSRNAPPLRGEERCVTTLKTGVQQTKLSQDLF